MIDSHAHLTDERFSNDVADVVERARAAGLEAIVTVGTDLADSRAAVELAARFELVVAAVGIHPHAAHTAGEPELDAVLSLAQERRVVAIGETGLDYHYDFSPRDAQQACFVQHLRMAARVDLPVIVHAREADDDLCQLIASEGEGVAGVLHSFSSGRELLDLALGAGWYVSFAGMITFKNYQSAELLRALPLDRLLMETDSPYLTPVPHRGRRNEPAHVGLVAARAAEIRGEDPALLLAATTRNARRLFRLDRWIS